MQHYAVRFIWLSFILWCIQEESTHESILSQEHQDFKGCNGTVQNCFKYVISPRFYREHRCMGRGGYPTPWMSYHLILPQHMTHNAALRTHPNHSNRFILSLCMHASLQNDICYSYCDCIVFPGRSFQIGVLTDWLNDMCYWFQLTATETMNYDDAFTLELVEEQLIDNFNYVAGIVPIITNHIQKVWCYTVPDHCVRPRTKTVHQLNSIAIQ